MKKILIVAAAAGLISLAACNTTPTNTAQENAVESHEANADYYQDVADNSSNAVVANAADTAEAVEENKAEAAENKH
ncbi:MAG: hypothetical protein V4574_06995 [Pseudomonadota bacterium]